MRGQRSRRRKFQSTRRVSMGVAIIGAVLVLATLIDDMRFLMAMSEIEAKVPEVNEVASDAIPTETVVPTEQSESFALEPELEVGTEPSALAQMMSAEYYENLDDTLGRVVLVDISEQLVWAFEQGEVVLESSTVTGLKDHYDTQLGVYSVILKRQNYTMRGSYGRVKVNYWMRFNDAYAQGLHDATWRNEETFGGDTYVRNGSHGCVNLPVEFTAKLYDFVEVGTPVIVQE